MKTYTLEELQALPHKWWKTNREFVPATKNYYIGERVYLIPVSSTKDYSEHLRGIFKTPLFVKKKPGLYDYLYAINTELLEYWDAVLRDNREEMYLEMADIAIFAGLCLRVIFNCTLENIGYVPGDNFPSKRFEGLYTDDNPNLVGRLQYLLLWGLQGGQVLNKLNFNAGRIDHDHST